MNFPRISLVTPCYNHEKYIGRTIESVISQGYPNLQYIVINDGSTDNSSKIIQRYLDQIDLFLDLEGHRPSPVWGLNQGFQHVDGEILGWISSDDVLLPKSLFTVAKAFRDVPNAQWVTGLASTINERDEVVNCKTRFKQRFDFLIGQWQVIQQESTYFCAELWQKAGGQFNEDFLQAFDTELWTRFFEHSELHHLQAPLGAFRKGQQSRSTRNIEEFNSYNDRAILRMREKLLNQVFLPTQVYKMLRNPFIRKILASFPNNWLLKLLPKFSEPLIEYNFILDSWQVSRHSSFRRI